VIKIRLQRAGRKNLPLWRVVATDSRAARDGRAVEILGQYDPRAADEEKLHIKIDRAKYWLKQGAKCSNTLLALLAHIGIDEHGGDISPRPWKKKKVKPVPEPQKAEAATEQATEEEAKPAEAKAPAQEATEEAPTEKAEPQPAAERPPTGPAAGEEEKPEAPAEETPVEETKPDQPSA